MKNSILFRIPCRKGIGTLATLVLAAVSAPGQIDCVETNGVKVLFSPNIDGGLDVLNTYTNDGSTVVLADDFSCNTTGPITDIHLWGSWLSDVHGLITNVWMGIYDDVPAVTNLPSGQITPSHPGTNLLWQQTFGPGEFAESIYASGNEGFFDPRLNDFIGGDTNAYYYCFYPATPFVQQGTAAKPTNYWLAAYVKVAGGQPGTYGWKTALSNYNDAAVWGKIQDGTGLPVGDWQSLTNLQTLQPINLSFKLTTPTNQSPPVVCVESNGVKYVQVPKAFNGYDVWNSTALPPGVTDGPWVLADDFICTNTGPISDIHLWGSWLADQALTNSVTFWIAIFDDVPANPPAAPYSHPGKLLWEQCFAPGDYAESLWGTGQEYFMDPGQAQVLGDDTEIWYYCFYPTKPFVQQGAAANPTTYWVAAFAQLPAGVGNNYVGWKTTTNVQHDVSVHALWNSGYCPTNLAGAGLAWTPTSDPLTGSGLDLAFKLTTPTNACALVVHCAVDKTNECGTLWSFDPPIIDPEPCCPANPTVTVTTTTNILGPCQKIFTRVWTISDCQGTTETCTQNVTVVDTTPPVLTCASNKTVVAGTPWTFDPPTADDECCGTNVAVFIVNTFTNGTGCTQLASRIWQAVDCCENLSDTCTQVVTIVCPTNGCCPDNGDVKWVQHPNTVNGVDIDFFSTHSAGIVLADDFQCTNDGYISDIHLWGSWTGDVPNPNQFVTLGIWSDVPAGPLSGYSHPGKLLWSETFTNGQYTICPYTIALENIYAYVFFPGSLSIAGTTTNLYYLCFYPTNAFHQTGSLAAPTNYWLSVYAPPYFNWKSSSDAYNDSAVAGNDPGTNWTPIPDPVSGQQLNFSFKITTATSNPPPVVCVENDFDKYVQVPRIIGGFDVWNTPYVLADDFVCTNTGPLSDIHLWGSWLADDALTNSIVFWLGIYNDVPAGPGNANSHPGTNLLWQQWFTPGQYAETIWNVNAAEQFLNPGQTNILGSDSVVWYYCFYPTNAFEQLGSSTNPITYWLAAYAQLPVGINQLYGWKTTTNVLSDTSVHAVWSGTPPILNAGWMPTVHQPAAGGPPLPLDLAFKLTSCGPVRIQRIAPTNVVVTWPGGGHLQSATKVTGPYVDVPGFPTSPYTDYSVTPTNKFYRLRCY